MKNKNILRIISKLDIKNGFLIKGINLEGLRILGDPYEFAKIYSKYSIDEIFYQDNVAALYGTNNLSKFIQNTSRNINVPLSVGGGLRSLKDIELSLSSGADKVCLNSAVINDINFLKKAAKEFGSANINVLIEVIKINQKYFTAYLNGRELFEINPVDWSKKIEDNGAGEITVTSVNNEGLKSGFDIKLINRISKNVRVPLIAHGGAGEYMHILKLVQNTDVDGVMIAGMFHYHYLNLIPNKIKFSIGNSDYLNNFKRKKVDINFIENLKKFLKKNNINVRL